MSWADEMQFYMGIIVFGAVLVFTFVAVYDGSTRIAGIDEFRSLALCGLSINQSRLLAARYARVLCVHKGAYISNLRDCFSCCCNG